MNNIRPGGLNRKLTTGTEVIFNGKTVYVEHDKQDGFINLRTTKQKSSTAETFVISKSEIQIPLKYNKAISSKPKSLTPAQISDKADMNSFFDSLWQEKERFNCMSCRKPLYAFNKTARRAVSCHILPKTEDGGFPSIAKNPDNIIFMGCDVFGSACDCHTKYDSSVEKRVRMPIYELVLKRFELLKPHLSPKEIIKAQDYLGITTKSLNLSKDVVEGKI